MKPFALSTQALHCQDMLLHAQHILGVEIVLTLEHLHELQLGSFSMPLIQPGSRSSSKTTQTLPAMLMPRDAEFYVLYRDVNDGIYVRAAAHSSMFILQKHWHPLSNVLPQDSVCRVVAYKNKAGKPLKNFLHSTENSSGPTRSPDGQSCVKAQDHIMRQMRGERAALPGAHTRPVAVSYLLCPMESSRALAPCSRTVAPHR